MKKLCLPALLFLFCNAASSQHLTEIRSQAGEYWWGGVVAFGSKMPYLQPLPAYDLGTRNNNNQVAPLLLSNKGRYVWSDYPFTFEVAASGLNVRSDREEITVRTSGSTLRDAYLAACRAHFKPTGVLPDELFFTMPQYNTWIELMYNQNQDDILKYAGSVIDNGFPGGVLMIDDNWQKYYGNFEFKPEKFPGPKAMVDKLHGMGFKVMLWVCPFVSADSPEYRFLSSKGYLLKSKAGDPLMIRWWNGYSACYDLTNPEAAGYFVSVLKGVQRDYGIDGFKFDAGDNNFYPADKMNSYRKDALPVDHTEAWAKIGLEFPFNEYRACWKMGGEALVQRLGDKHYSWDAVRLLIPEMIAAGLLGYSYTCPDMIGGGQYSSFLNLAPDKFNQELIVRSAQVHALMPMMQFSVAPWRVLDEEHLDMVRNVARLHERMGDYIIQCAKESAQTGEPIVRHIEYAFPGEGFATCNDQFMLGDRYLVAPVVTEKNTRTVKLPKGTWKDDLGKKHKGGRTIEIDVPLSRLPYFERIN